jgi:hypothetical protein
MARRKSNARSSKRIAAQKEGFRSHFEREVAAEILACGGAYDYEPEDAKVKYTQKLSTYTPDFVLPNGIIIETKGRLTVHDRTKHKLIRDQHPELDIRFVFQYDNPIFKGSKTKYSMWAEKQGFKWAIRYVPKAWLKEKANVT